MSRDFEAGFHEELEKIAIAGLPSLMAAAPVGAQWAGSQLGDWLGKNVLAPAGHEIQKGLGHGGRTAWSGLTRPLRQTGAKVQALARGFKQTPKGSWAHKVKTPGPPMAGSPLPPGQA